MKAVHVGGIVLACFLVFSNALSNGKGSLRIDCPDWRAANAAAASACVASPRRSGLNQ